MATNDVPGSNPQNNDTLKPGCWAEHDDGSLIFVKDIDEHDRVIFDVYDLGGAVPRIFYPTPLARKKFNETFSFKATRRRKSTDAEPVLWTWHDKSPFPWNKVSRSVDSISAPVETSGAEPTAAERIAVDLQMRMSTVLTRKLVHENQGLSERPVSRTSRTIADRLKNAIAALVG